MKKMRKFTSFTVLFSMLFMLLFAPISPVLAAQTGEENATQKELKDYTTLVQSAINDASANMFEQGVNSEWQAIGLAKAGKTIPTGYTDRFKQNIEDQITKGLETERIKITDIERLAMAAVALNKDPRDINGHNLIELIYNSRIHLNGSDTITMQGNNGPTFALIALDTNNFSVPEDAKWTREKLVAELLKNQHADGAWGLATSSTGSASLDITAMVLIGLAPYNENPTVKAAIDKAVAFLSQKQGPTGGFNDPWNGGVSVETTAQVIIGLTANDIDPRSEQFTKNDINLIDHLLSFKADDGGFKHLIDDTRSNGMATEQSLQALVAFDLYTKGEGRLYDFTDKVIEPEPTPDPEPEPTPDPDPTPEPTPEVDKVIELDKQIDVKKDEKIFIGDSKSNLTLPGDLPEGTKLEISLPDEKNTPIKGMTLAGDWFDFNFQYPSGIEQGTESYRLSLAVDEEVDHQKTGIYYFNEQTKQWEYVAGWGSAKDGTITIDVNHFSIYGVFTDTVGPSDVQVTEEKTTIDSITLGLSAHDPSGVKAFNIYRDGEQIAVVDGSKSEFTDTELKDGQAYEYAVVAVDELDNKSEKISLSATTIAIDGKSNPKDILKEQESTKEISNNKKNISSEGTKTALNEGKQLPKTATSTFNLMVIGIVLLTIGGVTWFMRKKNVLNS